MSSYYRERRDAGLYSADEEEREKAEKALSKDMFKRKGLGIPAVGDMKAEAAAKEENDEEKSK
jgi:hypothetical protein